MRAVFTLRCHLSQGGMGEKPVMSSLSNSGRFNFRVIFCALKTRGFFFGGGLSGDQPRPSHLCKSANTSNLTGLVLGR